MDKEVIIIIVVIALVAIYVLISERINTKKGHNSLEKQAIRKFANELIPEGTSYTVAYASHVEKKTRRGPHSKVTNIKAWYYAVAFQPNSDLWIIPLHYDNDELTHDEAIVLSKEHLHRVTVRGGAVKFYNAKDERILEFDVQASNTKNGIECPMNIQQKEEYEAFVSFIQTFADRVNDANQIPEKDRKYRILK